MIYCFHKKRISPSAKEGCSASPLNPTAGRILRLNFFRKRVLIMDTSILSALAEPNRLHIVEYLRERPHTVGEIAEELQIRQPQVSKHLRVLSEAGLVEAQPDANRRIYRLRAQPFRELNDWLGSYRQLWEDRFDRLDDYLTKLQTPKDDHSKSP